MTLLLCAATARELAGLAPGFAPPGLPPLAVAPAGATDDPWPEMRLWPLPLRRGRALCCLTGVGPLNAALALGLALVSGAAIGVTALEAPAYAQKKKEKKQKNPELRENKRSEREKEKR